MTALQMKEEFLARYDAASSLAAPGWENSEISVFLNIGQEFLIKELFNQRKYELLSNIIVESGSIADSGTTPLLESDTYTNDIANTYTINLNALSDFFIYFRSRSYFRAGWIYNEEIDPLHVNQFIRTNHNFPFFRVPKAYIEFNKLRIVSSHIPNNTGIAQVKITYVKKPDNISIDGGTPSELNAITHRDIIDYAVSIAIESVKGTKTVMNPQQ